MLRYLLGLTLAVLLAPRVAAAPDEDLVTDLPGLTFKPTFKHYSGYLQAGETKFLHYWFVESTSNPSRDPLVLWLNGGPGCSSVLGLLTEHGPFQISNDSQSVLQNPFAWNQVANMIYLESPAGVGFSYDTNKDYTSGDNETAQQNYLALKDFFKKFPEYIERDFYITGESYGGIYVPTLTSLVMQDVGINLKGFAVGNGLSSYNLNDNSLIYFVYYHGLIGNSAWFELLKLCCPQNDTAAFCDFTASTSTECQNKLVEVQTLVWASGLNVYNLYSECEGGVSSDLTLRRDEASGKYVTSNFGYPLMFLKNTEVSRRRQKALELQSKGNLMSSPPCVGDDYVGKYLNREDVKKALHVSPEALTWQMCSDVLKFKQEYDTMKPQYEAAISKKLRILVYNGDVDMACNFLGDEWFVDSLHVEHPQERKAWYYIAEDGTKQNAGYVKAYDQVTFVTVRGSGHMVPTDKPRPALEMFINFIQDKPF